ncbi:hypothetical protein M413DRAFT_188410 [Hebeloma cylindrosporum]|uniref:Uncharacterized protein n=1 Tax=Hebeloma cylindrosporum TaxID=76867 RepID=A0A0C3BTF9_HEBCY|nr:hypothetical protein M413DRAFT_188410 [Hebeloma cylindrosporum h7]
MTIEDVCNTLIQQNMIYIREPTPPIIRPSPGQTIKFPKGRKNGVARRQLQRLQSSHTPTYDGNSHSPTPKINGHGNEHDTNKGPFVPPKHYEIRFEREKVEAYLRKWESKGYMRLKPEKLQWTPYLVTRSTQEAPKVDLPAMDTLPVNGNNEVITPATTESVVVVVSEPPTEAVTPAPTKNGVVEDVVPMVVDVEEPRGRTRSAAGSCSSPPPIVAGGGRSLRSHGNVPVVEEGAVATRRRKSKKRETARKRRRIESSPEVETVVVKWEDDQGFFVESDLRTRLEEEEDEDLDAEGEPDTEFVM